MKGYGTKYDKIIKREYRKISAGEMARRYKPEKCFFLRRIKFLKLKVPAKVSNEWKYKRKQDTTFDKFITKNYLKLPVKRLATTINKSHTFVQDRLKKLGLKIPRKIIEQRIIDSRIKKGNVPVNKGKKWKDFMSKEGMKASRKTQYKRRHLPHNTLSDGTISIRHNHKNRNNPPYAWIRIKKAKWKMLHVKMWEDKYGRVPKNKIIVFKDKNTMNITLSNLEMITKAENMKRNTIHNLPPELKDTAYLIGRLTRQINKYEKQNRRSA